jgi:hypothetical protein
MRRGLSKKGDLTKIAKKSKKPLVELVIMVYVYVKVIEDWFDNKNNRALSPQQEDLL